MYSPIEVMQYAQAYAKATNYNIIESAVAIALRKFGVLKNTMSKADAYRECGSRRRVDSAIKHRHLKCVKKGARIFIRRDDFDAWMNKHEFES